MSSSLHALTPASNAQEHSNVLSLFSSEFELQTEDLGHLSALVSRCTDPLIIRTHIAALARLRYSTAAESVIIYWNEVTQAMIRVGIVDAIVCQWLLRAIEKFPLSRSLLLLVRSIGTLFTDQTQNDRLEAIRSIMAWTEQIPTIIPLIEPVWSSLALIALPVLPTSPETLPLLLSNHRISLFPAIRQLSETGKRLLAEVSNPDNATRAQKLRELQRFLLQRLEAFIPQLTNLSVEVEELAMLLKSLDDDESLRSSYDSLLVSSIRYLQISIPLSLVARVGLNPLSASTWETAEAVLSALRSAIARGQVSLGELESARFSFRLAPALLIRRLGVNGFLGPGRAVRIFEDWLPLTLHLHPSIVQSSFALMGELCGQYRYAFPVSFLLTFSFGRY